MRQLRLSKLLHILQIWNFVLALSSTVAAFTIPSGSLDPTILSFCATGKVISVSSK